MSSKKVAFLVDFDNVATDVIEQALNAVFKDYGAAHIRRAYCNAEQALREQNFLKRLGLRAVVNLAIGKNSTDIALAADAMDLAITEKPDVIVLVSSDSDFAPLVLRLREKGAWLRGFGQYGKTGDGVIQIYDQFNELAHGTGRSARDAAPPKGAGGGRNGRRGNGRAAGGRPQPEAPRANAAINAPTQPRPPRADMVAAAAAPLPVAVEPLAPAVQDTAPSVAAVVPVAAPAPSPAQVDPADKPAKPAGKVAGKATSKASAKATGKTAAKAARKPGAEVDAPRDASAETKGGAKADPKADPKVEAKAAPLQPVTPEVAEPAAVPRAAKPARPPGKAAAPAENPQVAAAKEINAVLALLPKLADGQWHDLGAAAKVLKDAGLLPKSAPATKLFRKHAHAFELQPEKQPNQVRFAT
ncbi:NYN domain-containing protein [Roseateles sp. BYS96W]|uniref:NYN domain-containing protein n=1 Tax=Pelomonas nitida TaxID=3299027 RepID=A0ABW7GC48_9BURK